MNGPHGHHLLGGIGGVVDVRHDAAGGPRIVVHQGHGRGGGGFRPGSEEGGHVYAGNMPGLKQQAFTSPAGIKSFFKQFQNVGQAFFAIAQHHDVNKGRQRLRAEQRSAACNDKGAGRKILRPVSRAQGNASQIKHVEDVGITKLMRDGKTQAMGLPQWGVGFQRGQGRIVGAQDIACFAFWSHDPLSPPVGAAVDDIVQNFLPQIGHADVIGIGKGQSHTQTHVLRVFSADVVFNAGITAGFGQKRQKGTHGLPYGGQKAAGAKRAALRAAREKSQKRKRTYLIRPLPEPPSGSELNCILPRPPATVRLVQASMYLS